MRTLQYKKHKEGFMIFGSPISIMKSSRKTTRAAMVEVDAITNIDNFGKYIATIRIMSQHTLKVIKTYKHLQKNKYNNIHSYVRTCLTN